jgi:hypothetical protein
MFWDEKTRKPIPMKTKRKVFKRAKGKCEKCGRSLKINEGDFHHTRDPSVAPRVSSVRFLCPTCHRIHGHERVTRKRETLLGTEKEVKVVRKDVVKVKKPKKKPKKTRRVAIRDLLGNVTGYRTVKVRQTKTAKKKPTTKSRKKKTRRRKKSDEWSLF